LSSETTGGGISIQSRAFISLALTCLLVLSSPYPAAGSPEQALPPFVEGQLLVGMAEGMSATGRDSVHGRQGARVLKRFEEIGVDLVRLSPGRSVSDARRDYGREKSVRFVEPNYLRTPFGVTPNDPEFSKQWGLRNTGQTVDGDPGVVDADIDASEATGPDAWGVTTGTSQPVVAVIDTGVQIDHSDLAGNIWTNPGEIPGNGIDDDGNGYIDDIHGWNVAHDNNSLYDSTETCPGAGKNDDHGSHVAGILGAVGNNGVGIAGVNWTVRIMPLKFIARFGTSCGGSDADAIEAILYAVRMGADFINASWGGGEASDALRQAFIAAGQKGVLFAAAAGNEGADLSLLPQYPASYDLENEIVVAASDNNDSLALFSNYGGPTDLAAPGVDIFSTVIGGYAFLDGTSMATPFVTGALGLLRAQYPHAPPLELKDRILDTVDPKSALEAPKTETGGRPNLNTAVRNVRAVIPTLTFPNGGEVFEPESTVNITWKTNIPPGNPTVPYRVEYTADANQSTPLSFDFEAAMPAGFSSPADSDAAWSVVPSDVRPQGSGGSAARSGAVGNNQASWLSTSRTFSTSGSGTFWYKVSSENCEDPPEVPVCGDYLRFYIDGRPEFAEAGSIGWTKRNFSVSAGKHTFSWAYQKDELCPGIQPECAGMGPVDDAAWIDDVQFAGIDSIQWSLIGTTAAGATARTWIVPSSTTSAARVRVCPDTGVACDVHSADSSDGNFSIASTTDAPVSSSDASGWESLGGALASGPDAASWEPNRLDVFSKGEGGDLVHAWWDGAQWNGWESLGGTITSDPTAVSSAPSRLDVFARGTDDALWTRQWDGSSWSPWISLGGVLASGPDVASWEPNRLDVFAKGTDGALWQRYRNGAAWSPWIWLEGFITSDPTAVSWGPGRIDIFARGTDDGLWQRYWDGAAWSAWIGHGGVLASGPDAASWESGRLDVFVRGTDEGLWQRAWTGTDWIGWFNVGGPGMESDPTAVSWGPGRIDVFARHGATLIHRWYTGSWQP